MNGSLLTPETYEQLIGNGFKYLALNGVTSTTSNGTEFTFTALKEMPFSFSQSLTSINDNMIQGIVYGTVNNIHITILPEEEIAIAA